MLDSSPPAIVVGPTLWSYFVGDIQNNQETITYTTILKPLSGLSKFRFCIRVLITSRGAETIREADAPAIEATKFCIHVALL